MEAYETELDKKTKLLESLERDYKQAMVENETLGDKLFKLNTEKLH